VADTSSIGTHPGPACGPPRACHSSQPAVPACRFGS
jgi:hypothetical protein